jgi:hypothetical protein
MREVLYVGIEVEVKELVYKELLAIALFVKGLVYKVLRWVVVGLLVVKLLY